ncbi:MAG: hypothetical protein WKH64_00045 [Chloroflexia bacterium]
MKLLQNMTRWVVLKFDDKGCTDQICVAARVPEWGRMEVRGAHTAASGVFVGSGPTQ